MLKLVIFDMDGVIIDSEPFHIEAIYRTLLHHSINVSPDEIKQYVGYSDENAFNDLISRHHLKINLKKLIRDKNQMVFKTFPVHIEAIDGVVELIEKFKSRGLKLALASSSPKNLIDFFLDKMHLTAYFKIIVSGDDVTNKKPDPEMYLKIINDLSLKPSDCLVIEDSNIGIQAAKSAGVKCLAYNNPSGGDQDLSQADMIFYDFFELDVDALINTFNV